MERETSRRVECWTRKILSWLLLIYSFKFRSAFQPRSSIPAVAAALVEICERTHRQQIQTKIHRDAETRLSQYFVHVLGAKYCNIITVLANTSAIGILWPNGWMHQDTTWYEGHTVLDKHSPPILGPCLLWPNGWMDQDATWYGGRRSARPHCVRWGPTSPPKGHSSPLLFCPCLLWPNGWMDQDASW